MGKLEYQIMKIQVMAFDEADVITASVTDGIGVTFDEGKWGISFEEGVEQ